MIGRILLLLLIIGVPGQGIFGAERTVGKIIDFKRGVEIKRGEASVPIRKKTKLKTKDVIKTDKNGRIFIEIPKDEVKIQLAANTEMGVLSHTNKTDEAYHNLKSGRAWVNKKPGDVVVRINTPLGFFKAIDAQLFFEVGPGHTEKMAIKSGRAELEWEGGKLVLMEPAEITLISGLPPIVKGLGEKDFLLWAEPYEQY